MRASGRTRTGRVTSIAVATLTAVAGVLVGVGFSVVTPSPAAAATNLSFVAITPCRIVDTRRPGAGGAFGTGERRDVQVAGSGPRFATQGGAAGGCGMAFGTVAVEATVTAVGPSGNGFARTFPSGTALPNATFLNFNAGESIGNTGTIPVSADFSTDDMAVQVFGASTQIVIDVQGYYTTGAGLRYRSIAPCRMVDTRQSGAGGALATNERRSFYVQAGGFYSTQGGTSGGCGLPATTTAIEATITAVGPSGDGFARAFPNTTSLPNATFLNFNAGESIGNTGTISVDNVAFAQNLALQVFGAGTHVVIDIQGYFTDLSGLSYATTTPCRLADTRAGILHAPLAAGESTSFQIAGAGSTNFANQGGSSGGCGIPIDAVAVEVTVTAVGPSGDGFARAWAAGTPAPNATFLNFSGGESIGNTGTIPINPVNHFMSLTVFNNATHIVIDVLGYFRGPITPPPPPTLASGQGHTCGLAGGGTVKCWGSGGNGQMGNGTTTTVNTTPVTVSGLTGATSLTAGNSHTCAARTDRTIRCWGSGGQGQLGDGTTTTTASTPVIVSGLTDATAVAAGGQHTCALRTNGTVLCWGDNEWGQLGNATTTDSSAPINVAGLSGVTALDAGNRHTCARINDGTVRCWGHNPYGQLGRPSAAGIGTPVTGLTGVTEVSAGGGHTCATLTDGTARCWGWNPFGQLGNGATNTSHDATPRTVEGLTGATTVLAGSSHSCAVLTDGTARCWGNNTNGKLGDGTSTDSTTPVFVAGINSASTVAGDLVHTCARLADGTARCWGRNNAGQLGNATTNDSEIRVTVVGYP